LRIHVSLAIALFALVPLSTHAAAPIPKPCAQPPLCSGSTCQGAINSTSATIPDKPCPRFGSNQDDVDVFSWNEFIAYNWPASKTCSADLTKSIVQVKSGANGPLVWQSQESTDDIFVSSGRPKGWCSTPTLLTNAPRPFRHIAKADPAAKMLGADFAKIAEPDSPVQAGGGILTDASGRWVRYEKLVNLTEYQYITSNNLWNKAGLAGKTVTFPQGSTEFKASWKVLTPAEIASRRYYTTSATVYNTPDGSQPSPLPNPVTLGLVGLHIVHKGPAGFFWSTFEFADNDRVFVDPRNPAGPNIQTAKAPYREIDPATKKPTALGVNVKRLTPIPANQAINDYYRGLLAGSVFANYRLVSTQWQFNLNTGGFPQYVANITLETYVQRRSKPDPKGPNLQPFTGCLSCHAFSPWDQSFVFIEAK
jgi:hypothetical protein